MNEPRLRIDQAGALATLQDAGRPGLRRLGVPGSGILVPPLMAIANRLAGNGPDNPVIEAFGPGLRLTALAGPVRLGLAGALTARRLGPQGEEALKGWRSLTLAEGESLRIDALLAGRLAVVAVAGLALPPQLGSVSTYTRARLGGLTGGPLTTGDTLPAGPTPVGPDWALARPWTPEAGPIRVIPGPQDDHFTPEALATFLAAQYRLTPEADRMGLRLAGPALAHRPGRAEIVSDGTVPGAIQVPGNGAPIVLLADGQTAGGYPKIATVIQADLPRLAWSAPGTALSFQAVSLAQARQAAQRQTAELEALLAGTVPLIHGEVDAAALYRENLVGGAIHALAPEYRPLTTDPGEP
ncbi:MAG: biotin-dependent carboxyltransferase family protein [Rhodocyclaceae bacterium]|nr:biotin-dependent carboxyltransferase family protein [Rhodocyclaceae bacterium]